MPPTVSKFHARLLHVHKSGDFELKDIAIDQTPHFLVLGDCTSYSDKCSKDVWCVFAACRLEKCQCTLQLTTFPVLAHWLYSEVKEPNSPQGAKFLGLMSSVQLLGVCFNKSLQAA